jgi:tRNA(Ile)-lysidine synthase
MLESFLTFINQQKLDLSKKSTLLTVSGGVDSVVMARLFYRAGLSAGIAHCNFGLRNEESDGDELFVRQLAEQYNYPVFITRFDTKSFAQEHGISTQMTARNLRYQWFEEVRKRENYDFVATAHHINDSIETVMLNLARGTGLAGLHGIAIKKHNLIRPLLFASRQEILHYAAENHIPFREDSSNSSTHYKRNLVRHEVIPVLKQLNPALEKTFKGTLTRLKAAEALLENSLKEWQDKVVEIQNGDLLVPIEALTCLPEPVYRLWFILQHFGFSYGQVEDLFESVDGISGKQFQSGSHTVLKDRQFFIVSERKTQNTIEELIIEDLNGTYLMNELTISFETMINTVHFKFENASTLAYINEDKLIFPLLIRNWALGDRLCPFGMKGKSKKVSDLLIDQKLNLNQKKNVRVLLNGNGDIIWVIGLRADERYKISDTTERITVVRINGSI